MTKTTQLKSNTLRTVIILTICFSLVLSAAVPVHAVAVADDVCIAIILVACGYALYQKSDSTASLVSQFKTQFDTSSLQPYVEELRLNGHLTLTTELMIAVDQMFQNFTQGLTTWSETSVYRTGYYLPTALNYCTGNGHVAFSPYGSLGNAASLPSTSGHIVSTTSKVGDLSTIVKYTTTTFNNPLLHTPSISGANTTLQVGNTIKSDFANTTGISSTYISTDLGLVSDYCRAVNQYCDNVHTDVQTAVNNVNSARSLIKTAVNTLSNLSIPSASEWEEIDESISRFWQTYSDFTQIQAITDVSITDMNIGFSLNNWTTDYRADTMSKVIADSYSPTIGSTVVVPPNIGQYDDSTHDIVVTGDTLSEINSDTVFSQTANPDVPVDPDNPDIDMPTGSILDVLRAILEWLKNILATLINNIVGAIRDVISAITSLGNTIVAQFTRVIEAIQGLQKPDFGEFFSTLRNYAASFTRFITGYQLFYNVLAKYIPIGIVTFAYNSWVVALFIGLFLFVLKMIVW